jgi:cytochrome c oxidase cbb3-type subunit II
MANMREWLPTYQRFPPGWATHPRKKMLMTPLLVFLGGIFAFAIPTLVAGFFQMMFFSPPVSNNWSPLTASAIKGREVFVANGCLYCHSGYTRPQDVREGLYYLYPHISLPGDFVTNDSSPNLFGTARIGPDLSMESGFHPDDWERAHFSDPRYVEPLSIMPRWIFLSTQQVEDLTTYLQLRAGKDGLVRYAGIQYMKKANLVALGLPDPLPGFKSEKLTDDDVANISNNATSPDGNVDGLDFPDPVNLNIVDRGYWLMDEPLPITKENLLRGRVIFQERCIGCHGVKGDAVSNAAKYLRPIPIDFTVKDDASGGNDTSPGDLYYRVLRGIAGTAMENFGTRLRVDDIWRVVMFLKTIPNGGLYPDQVPDVSMYIQWSPPDTLLQYIAKNPIAENQSFQETEPPLDAFVIEARRCFAGLNDSNSFDLPGFGTISLAATASGIKTIYDQLLNQGWNDYTARGGTPDVPITQKDIPPNLIQDQQ